MQNGYSCTFRIKTKFPSSKLRFFNGQEKKLQQKFQNHCGTIKDIKNAKNWVFKPGINTKINTVIQMIFFSKVLQKLKCRNRPCFVGFDNQFFLSIKLWQELRSLIVYMNYYQKKKLNQQWWKKKLIYNF